MKRMKKASALFLVLLLTMSLLTVPAFAAGTGSITIENTTAEQPYNVYKVFHATYNAAEDSAAYTIKSTDPWYALVSAEDSPFLLSVPTEGTTESTYNVTMKEGKDSDDVLAWFQSLSDNNVTVPAATATKEGTGSELKFDGLENGYYYVTSGLGALVTLTNLNNTVEIVDKNQKPSWDTEIDGEKKTGGKYVLGDDGVTWGTANTAAIGDTLHYKIVLYAAPNYTSDGQITEFVFNDTESSAIYADLHSMKVTVDGVELTNGWILGYDSDNADYATADTWHKVNTTVHDGTESTTVKPYYDWYIENTVPGDDQYSIHINWADYQTGKPLYPEKSLSVIEITYDAVLESNATVGQDTSNNKNSVTPQWKTDNDGTESGTEKTTETTTFGFAVEKKDGTTNNVLQGVEFSLRKKDETEAIEVYPSKEHEGRYYAANDAGEYDDDANLGTDAEPTLTTTLTTNADGELLIIGLKGGEYVLTETKPLDGYNRIEDTTITLTVPESDTGWTDVDQISALQFEVKNYKGTVLPETGSIGTKLFIIIGSIAVIGAGIFLVANKRMRKENF